MKSVQSVTVRRVLGEGLGTSALVLIGPGASMVAASTQAFGHAGVAFAFGAAVTLLVATVGPISGAHLNPAVTVAFWSMRRFPARDVAPYVLAQCGGAILAALTLRWMLGPVASVGATVPQVSILRAFVIEAGYSGFLMLVILAAIRRGKRGNDWAPYLIGTAVALGALVTGPLTGGSFNPARTLGPAIAAGEWRAHWLYWCAPIAGMLAATRLFMWFSWSDAERTR
ncbi:MAG: MIP/aquaporin family protein [Gemmatimonas sp.]